MKNEQRDWSSGEPSPLNNFFLFISNPLRNLLGSGAWNWSTALKGEKKSAVRRKQSNREQNKIQSIHRKSYWAEFTVSVSAKIRMYTMIMNKFHDTIMFQSILKRAQIALLCSVKMKFKEKLRELVRNLFKFIDCCSLLLTKFQILIKA